MRGSPLIQAVIAAFFILLLAWPVYRVTRPAPIPASHGQIIPPPAAMVYHLEIYFGDEPTFYTFEYLGKLLLDKRQAKMIDRKPGGEIIVGLPPTITVKGLDLMGEVKWADTSRRHAFEVKFIDGTGAVVAERTLWSENGKFEGRISLP
ncbi:MAG: hypothetical protein SGI98_00495 [Verrucomicrobiota bacterium]|nr:hypothetical protein [Verrucomicrobiota bacterium]